MSDRRKDIADLHSPLRGCVKERDQQVNVEYLTAISRKAWRKKQTLLLKKMNQHLGSKRRGVAVHDAHGLRNFWEEIIEETQAKQKEVEDFQLTRSALNKLRREWTQRLEGRLKLLQKASEKPKPQSSLLPIKAFQQIHKTVA